MNKQKQKTVYKQCQNKLSCSALNDNSNDSNAPPPIYLRTVEKPGEKTKIWIIKEPSWKQTKRYWADQKSEFFYNRKISFRLENFSSFEFWKYKYFINISCTECKEIIWVGFVLGRWVWLDRSIISICSAVERSTSLIIVFLYKFNLARDATSNKIKISI